MDSDFITAAWPPVQITGLKLVRLISTFSQILTTAMAQIYDP